MNQLDDDVKNCAACQDLFIQKRELDRYCFECSQVLQACKGRERTRELVRIRDKHTCQSCKKKWNGGRRFDIHHLGGLCGKKSKSYDSVDDIHVLLTLCHKCHFNHPEHTLNSKK